MCKEINPTLQTTFGFELLGAQDGLYSSTLAECCFRILVSTEYSMLLNFEPCGIICCVKCSIYPSNACQHQITDDKKTDWRWFCWFCAFIEAKVATPTKISTCGPWESLSCPTPPHISRGRVEYNKQYHSVTQSLLSIVKTLSKSLNNFAIMQHFQNPNIT